MVLDQLKSAGTYKGLGPLFDRAFAYLENFDPATGDGRYEIEGKRLYALVQSFDTQPPAERIFESHRVYADIHWILSGGEIIYYRQASELTPKAEGYDPERDATFYDDCDDRPLYLKAGDFVIFWPQDAHKPGCLHEASVHTRKVVLKVRLAD